MESIHLCCGKHIVEYFLIKVNKFLKIFRKEKFVIFKNIKKICEKKKISISQLEELAGLSKGSIYKWNTSIPKVDSLQKVANILKVKIEKLLEE